MSQSAYQKALQAAKKKLAKEYQRQDWHRGVGIAPVGKDDFALRISASPDLRGHAEDVPQAFDRFDVQEVSNDGHAPR